MSNTATSAGTELAAIIVSNAVESYAGKAAGGAAGLIVQPVVWAATGTTPDAGDMTAYLAGGIGGLISVPAAIPGIATGIVKAMVDDHTAGLVELVKADEPAYARNGIRPVGDYGFWASDNIIQAAHIAMDGGVVWKSHDVWVYVTDGKGRLVCDYRPMKSDDTMGPILPLQRGPNGKFNYKSYR